MVTFIGEYTSRVDDKGRLVFPAAFRAAMAPGSDMRFIVKKDLFSPCLEMYSFEEWEKQSNKVKDSLDLTFNKTHATFWREYMRDRDLVEPDARLGRISISRKLLDSPAMISKLKSGQRRPSRHPDFPTTNSLP